MVGQHFVTLLADHPWFEVVTLAASPASAGKTYMESVSGRWKLNQAIPDSLKNIRVMAVENDLEKIAYATDIVFCALDLDKERTGKLEIAYAQKGIGVVSCNSAHRWTLDVPMIIPEINPQHTKLIEIQRKNRGWSKGFIVVKPNCSIQSYTIIFSALFEFKPLKASIVSLQAISGAGKTFAGWPEMIDNVIPYIRGEEEKSVREPLKIFASLEGQKLKLAKEPEISATCIRVPVTDGHMASVRLSFKNNPRREDIIEHIKTFKNPIERLNLPTATKQLIHYFPEADRPQTKLDRDLERGMGIAMGRLEKDTQFDWRFISLSHNTIRGAAGGAILIAELLKKKGYR